MTFALLVVVANGLVTVPPSHWQAIAVNIPQNGSTVFCSYEVRSGAERLQALLLSRSAAERLNRGRDVSAVYSSGYEKSHSFRVRVEDAGQYVLLLDNRLNGRSGVEVALRLEVTHPRSLEVRQASRERRRVTVALSLLFFGAVLVFSARQYFRHS